MPKLSLTKSGLQREKQQLQLYIKLLPSLELKRTQLTAEYTRAKTEKKEFELASETAIEQIAQKMPMLANRDVALSGLLKIRAVKLEEQNVVGVKIPYLKAIEFESPTYSFLSTPHWVDTYIKHLKEAVETQVKLKIMQTRIEKLAKATRRMTQKVNLFEKILIPTSKKNIQKIRIALGDAERSAVIRSKLAKAAHRGEA